MIFLVVLAYVASAVAFYALIMKVAPVAEEPAWYVTAPPRSAQVVEFFQQSDGQIAA